MQYSKIEILSNFIYLGLVFFSPSKNNGDVFYLGFNTELGQDSGINRYILCNISSTDKPSPAECSGLLILAKKMPQNGILETFFTI